MADQMHLDIPALVYHSLICPLLVKFCFQIRTVPHHARYIHMHCKPRSFQQLQVFQNFLETLSYS